MFITGYRLLNLRNNSGNNSTDSHIVEVMLENINELDRLSHRDDWQNICDDFKIETFKICENDRI